jgi:hypothetical protein
VSSGTTATSKSQQFSPSGSMKHMRMGSVRISHHILTTQTEPWDFIKLSALYLSVHIEFSLRLSFYIKCSLRGYMVGTTAGIPIEIMEALALQSHRRILRKCSQYHMSTYSAHCQVTGSDHPLNGGLWATIEDGVMMTLPGDKHHLVEIIYHM